MESLLNFFIGKKSLIESNDYVVELGEPTEGRDDNSVSITILSSVKNIVIIVWERGFCHLDYLDWSKDDAWNESLKFDSDIEMLTKMENILTDFLEVQF